MVLVHFSKVIVCKRSVCGEQILQRIFLEHLYNSNTKAMSTYFFFDVLKTFYELVHRRKIKNVCLILTGHLFTKKQVNGQRNVVNVIWVPGHEGYAGSEKADFLPKQKSRP